MKPEEFLPKAVEAAKAGGHLFPEYAACEAALESAWGESTLCKEANNLFGQKAGPWTQGLAQIELPTHEWVHGVLVPTVAYWPKFPDWAASFAARMALLKGAEAKYPHYHVALNAGGGEEFVKQVSQTWSTDPARADKVLVIHQKHFAAVLS